jgi:hypothetical protein
MNALLTQFLIDVTRGRLKQDFLSEPARVLEASHLQEPLREAVRGQDIGALWLAGAHPMALLYFARACGWDNGAYYSCVANANASAKAAVQCAAARQPAPAQPQMHQ